MSVLYKSSTGCLLDHMDFISNQYENVTTQKETSLFAIKAELFCIKTIKEKNNLKRSRNFDKVMEETATVKELYERFTHEIPNEIKLHINERYNLVDTTTVRKLAKELFEGTVFEHIGINGGNNSDIPLQCKVKDELFLIPQNCRFFCGCVKEQCGKLEGNKYDIVIADPPWWNKYIRRLKGANDKLSYTMMYNEDIASIPLKNLFSENCLVAVWCTNAPSNITAVKDLIFPSWGVEYVATWYWMKVAIDLTPLCDFGSGCKKQPYERLMLGKVGTVEDLPECQIVVSVPSALHSHKPPILDLLSPYISCDNPKTLELFARYLLPNTTSVGYEPLKWQHMSLYEEVS